MEQNAFQWPALPLPKLSPRFRLAFLTACLVGFLTHLYLFTNTLLNHDSIHSLFTDNNVLSSGRWSAQLLSSFSTFFQVPVVYIQNDISRCLQHLSFLIHLTTGKGT